MTNTPKNTPQRVAQPTESVVQPTPTAQPIESVVQTTSTVQPTQPVAQSTPTPEPRPQRGKRLLRPGGRNIKES